MISNFYTNKSCLPVHAQVNSSQEGIRANNSRGVSQLTTNILRGNAARDRPVQPNTQLKFLSVCRRNVSLHRVCQSESNFYCHNFSFSDFQTFAEPRHLKAARSNSFPGPAGNLHEYVAYLTVFFIEIVSHAMLTLYTRVRYGNSAVTRKAHRLRAQLNT